MKPKSSTGTTSCSCLSCAYKSDSDRSRGGKNAKTRFEQLYGKDLPVRERQLIDKLARTRAEYDNLRSRLLSQSFSSIEKADLQPSNDSPKKGKGKDLQSVRKSSTIFELVNLVDTGATLSPSVLSKCCSCCICGPPSGPEDTKQKRRRSYLSSRSSASGMNKRSDTKRKDESRSSVSGRTKIQRRISKKRHATKHIQSAPCTCITTLSDLTLSKILGSKPAPLLELPSEEEGSKTRRKVKGYKTKQSGVKQSKKKKSKHSETDSSEEGQEMLFAGDVRRKGILKDWACDFTCDPKECKPEECFEIMKRKKSGKETLKPPPKPKPPTPKKKKTICICGKDSSDTVKKSKPVKKKVKPAKTKKVIETTEEIVTTVRVKNNQQTKTVTTTKQERLLKPKVKETKPKPKVKEKKKKKVTCVCNSTSSYDSKKSKLAMTAVSIPPDEEVLVAKRQPSAKTLKKQRESQIKSEKLTLKMTEKTKREEMDRLRKKSLAKKNRMSTGTDTTKTRSREKLKSKPKGENLKHKIIKCICEVVKTDLLNKGKSFGIKTSQVQRAATKIGTASSMRKSTRSKGKKMSVTSFRKSKKGMSKISKEPSLRREQGTSIAKSKSTKKKKVASTASTSREPSASTGKSRISQQKEKERPKKELSVKSHNLEQGEPQRKRSAVRISSNFSFDIEFYKDEPPPRLPKEEVIKPKQEVIKPKKEAEKPRIPKKEKKSSPPVLKSKTSSASQTSKKTTRSGNIDLKRCFCTLKLKPNAKKVPIKPNMDSKTMQTSESFTRTTASSALLPYECEPMICIPGECDPIECLKLIKKRKAAKTNTKKVRTKSTPSLTVDLNETGDSKAVQTKAAKTVKSIEPSKRPQIDQTIEPKKRKQAVRISSNFSFNIEFYRDQTPNKQVPVDLPPKIKSDKKRKSIVDVIKTKRMSYKPSKTPSSATSKHSVKKHNLKRCFCTLMLNKANSKMPTLGLSHSKSKQKQRTKSHDSDIGSGKETSKDKKKKKQQSAQNQFTTKSHHKSTTTQVHSKEKVVGPVKRCFCTLKLHKLGKGAKATKPEPAVEVPKVAMVSKSTNVKNKYPKHLEPYECEPYVCVPGECDPYECLERINRRLQGKTKSIDSGTTPDKMKYKSTSSVTDKSKTKNKNALIQSSAKAIKKNKKLKRSKYKASPSPSKSTLNVANRGRRGVRYGSNFSFTIDFHKDRYTHVEKEPVRAETSKITMKPKMFTSRHSHKIKHSEVVPKTKETKTNKKTPIQKVIKKCLCTLVLQNKTQDITPRPIKATVMPVQIFYESLAFHQGNTMKTRYTLSKHLISENTNYKSISTFTSSTVLINSISNESSNSTKLENLESKFENAQIQEYIGTSFEKLNSRLMSKINKHRAEIIGARPYLRSDIYALNLQVHNKMKTTHKLEPYECEPGVCIPGECDPIECQKLIMKRLMRKVSTMTTNDKSKTMSSNTAHVKPKQQHHSKTGTIKVKPGKERRSPKFDNSQKQAVRVGSSFSFDIEFYKDKKSSPPEKKKEKPTPSTIAKSTNRGTGALNDLRQDSTQVALNMRDQASSVAIKDKRCFCTLKLQKKGKQYQAPPKPTKPKVETVDTGQNTKRVKYLALDPNECEPGVCVPGECDPYECLERIKQRYRQHKDFSTNTRQSMMSSSSMTNAVKTSSKVNATRKEKKQKKPRAPAKRNGSPRQAVRIGSSFSFDVEFFKERRDGGDVVAEKPRKEKLPVKFEKTVQSTKNVLQHHTQSTGPETQVKSTKTGSLLQRCFCTAKLFNKSKDSEHVNVKESPSFLKRCICTLKSMLPLKQPHKVPSGIYSQTEKVKKVKINAEKVKTEKVNTDKQKYPGKPKLEPYECEPGVCIPGECDPYVCLERIKRRNANKMSSTEDVMTKTKSIGHKSKKLKSTSKQVATKRDRGRSKPIRRAQPTTSVSPNRSVVRIGSNFSFNVEFYKENTPTFQNIQRAAKEVKAKTVPKALSSKSKGIQDKTALYHSRQSQAEVLKENASSDANTMLKRCFCTLTLNKKGTETGKLKVIKPEMVTEGTDSPAYKTYPRYENNGTTNAKPYKLAPYECEPGICIPGQCNPHECLKLMMKGKEKKTGTITDRSITMSTMMKKDVKRKHHNAQSATKPKKEKLSKKLKGHPRQAVRIGSNFSFNIEFYKSALGKDVLQPEKQMSTISQPMKISTTSKTDDKRLRHIDTQVAAKKVQSTASNAAPFLKRCFCTLKFVKNEKDNKSQIIKNKPKTTVTEKIQTKPQKREKQNPPPPEITRRLEPYECEPGICVPGECDPYECLKRIQRRMQSKMSNTDGLKTNKTTTTIATKAKPHKTIKNQAKFGDVRDKPSRNANIKRSQGNKRMVRIGSSFDFNVEFHKERFSEVPYHTETPNARPIRSIVNKPTEVYYQTSSTYGHSSKSTDKKSTATGSRIGPLMKRCFCTLKLQKIGKLQRQHIQASNKTKNVHIQAYNTHKKENVKKKDKAKKEAKNKKEEKIQTKKQKHVEITKKTKVKKYKGLEPYECEPNFCIPGECDPVKCYERIKKRNLVNSGTETTKANKKCIACCVYCPDKKGKSKDKSMSFKSGDHSQVVSKSKPKKNEVALHKDNTGNRQSLRIGSNFSFSVEFNKNTSSSGDADDDSNVALVYPPKTSLVRKHDRACVNICPEVCNKNLQAMIAQDTKEAGVMPLLQRCFCTLALQNKNAYKSQPEPSTITHNKATTAKFKDPKPNKAPKIKDTSFDSLEPYECEPGVCIPGQCDPYECLERIKRRTRRVSRPCNTCEPGRCSQASETCPLKALKYTQFRGPEVSAIVEQPRFPFLEPNYYKGLRVGSNISFNIEFYKENIPPGEDFKANNHDNDLKLEKSKVTSSIKKTNTCLGAKCRAMQANKVKAEDKSSTAGTAGMKRCFCTAKLQKIGAEQKGYGKNMITVARVDQIITNSPFNPTRHDNIEKCQNPECDCEYSVGCKTSVGTKINTKYFSSDTSSKKKKSKSQKKNNLVSEFNNMETILPYAPQKFDAKKSKTLIKQKGKFNNNPCCGPCNCVKLTKNPRLTKKSKNKTTDVDNKQSLFKCIFNFFNSSKSQKKQKSGKAKSLINPEANKIDALDKSKSKRSPCLSSKMHLNKSKSLKSKKGIIKSDTKGNKPKNTKLQAGDADQANARNKKTQYANKLPRNLKNLCDFCDTPNIDGNPKTLSQKDKKSKTKGSSTQTKIKTKNNKDKIHENKIIQRKNISDAAGDAKKKQKTTKSKLVADRSKLLICVPPCQSPTFLGDVDGKKLYAYSSPRSNVHTKRRKSKKKNSKSKGDSNQIKELFTNKLKFIIDKVSSYLPDIHKEYSCDCVTHSTDKNSKSSMEPATPEDISSQTKCSPKPTKTKTKKKKKEDKLKKPGIVKNDKKDENTTASRKKIGNAAGDAEKKQKPIKTKVETDGSKLLFRIPPCQSPTFLGEIDGKDVYVYSSPFVQSEVDKKKKKSKKKHSKPQSGDGDQLKAILSNKLKLIIDKAYSYLPEIYKENICKCSTHSAGENTKSSIEPSTQKVTSSLTKCSPKQTKGKTKKKKGNESEKPVIAKYDNTRENRTVRFENKDDATGDTKKKQKSIKDKVKTDNSKSLPPCEGQTFLGEVEGKSLYVYEPSDEQSSTDTNIKKSKNKNPKIKLNANKTKVKGKNSKNKNKTLPTNFRDLCDFCGKRKTDDTPKSSTQKDTNSKTKGDSKQTKSTIKKKEERDESIKPGTVGKDNIRGDKMTPCKNTYDAAGDVKKNKKSIVNKIDTDNSKLLLCMPPCQKPIFLGEIDGKNLYVYPSSSALSSADTKSKKSKKKTKSEKQNKGATVEGVRLTKVGKVDKKAAAKSKTEKKSQEKKDKSPSSKLKSAETADVIEKTPDKSKIKESTGTNNICIYRCAQVCGSEASPQKDKYSKPGVGGEMKNAKTGTTKKMLKKEKMINSCVCGSKICSKEKENLKVILASGISKKKCVCGSKFCARESQSEIRTKSKLSKIENKLLFKKTCVCGTPVCSKEKKKIIKEQTAKLKSDLSSNKCVCGSKLCAHEMKLAKKNKTKDPCICRSKICDKESKKMMKTKVKQKPPPCTCGSKTCLAEAKKTLEDVANKKKLQKLLKIKKAKLLIGQKALMKRQKKYKDEDKKRNQAREKRNKAMLKQIKKNKNAGDCMLLSESLFDIGKLGFTSAIDILRSTCRTVTDPKNTSYSIKTLIMDPKRGFINIKNAIVNSGVGSTIRRVALRVSMMKTFKKLHGKMEQYAVTNYLVHMHEKDPKKRLKRKRKGPKRREPLDFDCSLYMGSLRRRPFLAVYYMCPWFYPHFLALLNGWKQFTDVMLFLLAVVVWSPCILTMEVCRAMMCCFLCTG